MSEHAVTTTINPGEVLVVDDAEYLDLTRYGLVAEEAPAPRDAAPDVRSHHRTAKA